MPLRKQPLDELRTGLTELENHHVDELVAGRLDRRGFLRRGAAIGISGPLLAGILTACGSSSSGSASASAPARAGGILRVAMEVPVATMNPLTVDDAGGLGLLCQTGEFLVLDNNLELKLEPMLATSWSPNASATIWTFKLRRGVKFQTGAPMTADDVVYTFQQLSDPKLGSNSLSVFQGVLTPEGVRKVDAYTVAFHLVSANGNFPYLVSSDNYNAIIVPKGTDYDKWQSTFIGTGPFKLARYTASVGATFTVNPHYWGPKPLLDGLQVNFYSGEQPQILALQGGDVDVITQFTPGGAQAILHNSAYRIIQLVSATHREMSMRCDLAPFDDPRVRQAVALTLNRPAMVKALLQGYGHIGNDSPFGPRFRSTNPSVPQRVQDIPKAKQLLAAAGHSRGFAATLTSENYQELPLLAQTIQADCAKAGIDIHLKVETQTVYYGKSTFGNSDWLDAEMSLIDYADRGVPNVLLEAPLTTRGPWNAARFDNRRYDSLVASYVAAVDLQVQRRVAGEIERLLLAQTPIIYPYFIDGLTATTQSVGGVNPTSSSQIFLGRAYKS